MEKKLTAELGTTVGVPVPEMKEHAEQSWQGVIRGMKAIPERTQV